MAQWDSPKGRKPLFNRAIMFQRKHFRWAGKNDIATAGYVATVPSENQLLGGIPVIDGDIVFYHRNHTLAFRRQHFCAQSERNYESNPLLDACPFTRKLFDGLSNRLPKPMQPTLWWRWFVCKQYNCCSSADLQLEHSVGCTQSTLLRPQRRSDQHHRSGSCPRRESASRWF